MAFTCPDCERVSHHPEDEKNAYCGHCKKFFRDTPLSEVAHAMARIFFLAAIHAASDRVQTQQRVLVVKEPKHTKNLFGPIEEIAGQELLLMERNPQGDCLCVFRGKQGSNLIDVDRRDILAQDHK